MTEGIKTISINNKMKTVKQIESTKSITYSTMKTGSVAFLQQTPLIIRLCYWSGIAGTLNPVEPRLLTAHRTHLLSVWQNYHCFSLLWNHYGVHFLLSDVAHCGQKARSPIAGWELSPAPNNLCSGRMSLEITLLNGASIGYHAMLFSHIHLEG